MSALQSPARARLSALWDAMRDRLRASPAVTGPLGAVDDVTTLDRVHVADEDVAEPAEGRVWGRVLVRPVERAFGVDDLGALRTVPVLVVVEFAPFRGHGWRAGVAAEAVHAGAYTILDGWRPRGVPGVHVVRPIWREAYPTPVRADPLSSLLYASAEYRVDVTSVPTP